MNAGRVRHARSLPGTTVGLVIATRREIVSELNGDRSAAILNNHCTLEQEKTTQM